MWFSKPVIWEQGAGGGIGIQYLLFNPEFYIIFLYYFILYSYYNNIIIKLLLKIKKGNVRNIKNTHRH